MVVDLIKSRAPRTESLCFVVLEILSISKRVRFDSVVDGDTHLTFEIDGCGAYQVAVVVRFLHGHRGFGP